MTTQSTNSSTPKARTKARRSILVLRWCRRGCQALFLTAFSYLLVETVFRGTFKAHADSPVRLGLPVEIFLKLDPFAALLTLLSSHVLYRGLALSVIVIALTAIFGRVFCGWICPLGTLNHLIAWIAPSKRLRAAKRIDANRTHPVRQRIKYYLLLAFLAAAITGSAIGGVFDPICLLVRGLGLTVIPAFQYSISHGLVWMGSTNIAWAQRAADLAQDGFTAFVWPAAQSHYHDAWLIALLFAAVLVMNRIVPRFWCRVLCPLGALLGTVSRVALFGMSKREKNCTNCNLCLLHCQGADSPQGGEKWRQNECHMCLNCEASCPEDVIRFELLPSRASTQSVDVTRRASLGALAAGAAFVPAARISDSLDTNYPPRLIRPPGSISEREFLAKCIRCGECMKVCPNNALHPVLLEAGVEGLWTPTLIPRIGCCDQSCVLCSQVCPTGAISKITEKDRLGLERPPIKIGTAFYDHGRCLPWSMNIPCIVCEEFCPSAPKAIWVEETQVPYRRVSGKGTGAEVVIDTVKLQRPHVDPSLCVGCGACEKACPVQDQPAIYVTNVGETRSASNVLLLEKAKLAPGRS